MVPDLLPAYDRSSFIGSLESAIAEGIEQGSNVGLILIDIHNLRQLNHTYGFEQGDRVLHEAYDALMGIATLPGTVFRIGAGRFTFILPRLTNPAFISLAMNRVNSVLEQSFSHSEGSMPPMVFLGVAVNKGGVASALEMLVAAEQSLHEIQQGKERKLAHFMGMEATSSGFSELEDAFYQSLHNNAFQIYYQPKVNLHTGRADAAEALLRFQLEDGSFVSPQIAVDMAEASGRGYALTKWVIHRAIRQLGDWKHKFDLKVAVNIQASLVASPDLVSLVKDSLAIWGVDSDNLALEITEGGFIEDKESGFDNLARLRELGVRLSIDDFGTGYSSLSYFKHIPASELKIDKSFIDHIQDGGHDLELVKIMIYIAHQFGLLVVAEGVEDEATCQLLKTLGCDYIQGYYFSRPLPAQEFERWLTNNSCTRLI